ncbi:hypothetical protein LQF61_09340, partial [Tetragenococcus koreensis]|uniref:hypothetical protein n=1 Tax=Tetragenococcus koreensis TaxID=290335 RepID=UPI001F1831FD
WHERNCQKCSSRHAGKTTAEFHGTSEREEFSRPHEMLLLKACLQCKTGLDEIMLIMQNNSADSLRRIDFFC